jgi:hypothetical protein
LKWFHSEMDKPLDATNTSLAAQITVARNKRSAPRRLRSPQYRRGVRPVASPLDQVPPHEHGGGSKHVRAIKSHYPRHAPLTRAGEMCSRDKRPLSASLLYCGNVRNRPMAPFRPPAPIPHEHSLTPFALLSTLRRNSLEC